MNGWVNELLNGWVNGFINGWGGEGASQSEAPSERIVVVGHLTNKVEKRKVVNEMLDVCTV